MKRIIFTIIILALSVPGLALAAQETRFKAKIVDIADTFVRVERVDNGERYAIEQNFDVIGRKQFRMGDMVLVNEIQMEDGQNQYVIVDFVRRAWIYLLVALFMLTVALVGGKQGLRSLFNLFLTLLIVLFVIIPLVLRGWNPVAVVVGGGSVAMLFNIYITYGFNKKSHGTLLSVVGSLVVSGLLSGFFVKYASLTGFVQEEAAFIVTMGYTELDMRGILLAAIIVGALGVIDDLAISQMSLVKELADSNKKMPKREMFKAAFRVGRDHTSSMVNTLVLAYAGAAFPLMILFTLGNPPFDSLSSILNNEAVATEIVRTLVGSIGLLLSMPIATWVGVWLFGKKKKSL